MKKYAIIVAGGSGQRMKTDIPKQFLLLKGKPLIYYTIHSFLQAFNDIEIILVLPEQYLKNGNELVAQMHAEKKGQLVAGGATRFASVRNGLQLVSQPSIVFVHDGVRCLVSPELIRSCYKQALEKGSAVPVVTATDSIRFTDGETHRTVDRNSVQIVQTPQTFQSQILLTAFQQNVDSGFTDEASVVEAAGTPVFLIEGDYTNLKITRPIDLLFADKLLEQITF